jgi:hypothetical protein
LAFHQADALISLAEGQSGLLRRCHPQNEPAATAAWLAARRRGERRELELRYAPPPALGPLRAALDRAAEQLAQMGAIGRLYAERASELELEARLAERVGQPGFARLARQRHAEGAGPEWEAARQKARAFCELPLSPALEPRHAAHDGRCSDSLVSVLAREIGLRRLPLRIELVSTLASRAACGDGVIYVRAGERLSAAQARRIAAHELLGHALPRLEARAHSLGLLRVGSARCTDDEEGRALHIEAREGLLDAERQRELGLRHEAAVAVAGGARAEECVALLGRFGCADEEALRIYVRVARAGGLCRELEYLPAWHRFEAALAHDTGLAAYLAHGRLSLDAARVLRAEGIASLSTCNWEASELPRCLT